MNLESKNINQESLPFENITIPKHTETVTISYDNAKTPTKTTNDNTTNLITASIALGAISLPFMPVLFSAGLIFLGGSLILLNKN